jgi:hypothetical protein
VGARGNGPGDGNCRVSEDAAAGAGLTAAEHCGAAHYSCCNDLPQSRWRAANGHEPSILD